jgi:hypothetical protein
MQKIAQLLVRVLIVLVAVWLFFLAVATANLGPLERALMLVLAAGALAWVAGLHRRPA